MPRIRLLIAALLALSATSCSVFSGDSDNSPLIVYSGRSESLVGPIIEEFEAETGIDVDVRWGSTSEMAATLLEEGENTPADVFFAQDPGGLGAVIDLLAPLPEDITTAVDPKFHAPDGRWVGVSGRARVIVFNTENLAAEALPSSIEELTDPQWNGRIGWAPTNSSFQTMVTAMRALWGEERTREWLTGLLENNPIQYESNTPTVAAVGAGEVDLGLVNHYYLYRFLAEEGETFPARNLFLGDGGPGSLVMVAGVGQLEQSDNAEKAQEFIRFLLSTEAQEYFSSETNEYPLAGGVQPNPDLPPLSTLNPPAVDLADLADLRGTVALLQEVGALP
ncbi:MAG: iron ABC transporter substrate-binding protein [Anaerolineales bacterium]|nr:iron ABC transporter substrate-binding protein [Anaerolineales bacterium]